MGNSPGQLSLHHMRLFELRLLRRPLPLRVPLASLDCSACFPGVYRVLPLRFCVLPFDSESGVRRLMRRRLLARGPHLP